MVTAETFQSPPIELTKKETEHTLNVFFDFMLKLQKYCNELIVVYIPSQTSSMNVGEIVYFEKYFPERSIKKSSKKNLDNLHNILVKKISDYSEKNRIIFLDTTKELREVGFNQNIWGIIDTQHLNKLGYKIIARKIYNDLYN